MPIDRVILIFFAASLFFGSISISLTQIALFISIILWGARSISARKIPRLGATALWIALFAIFSLIAAIGSIDPRASLADSRDLIHLLTPFIAYELARARLENGAILLRSIAAGVGALALVGMVEFFGALEGYHSSVDRLIGVHSQAMTFGGLTGLGLAMICAIGAFDFNFRRDFWLIPAGLASLFGLTFSMTRSAWIGFIGALVFVLARKSPMALIVVFGLVAPIALFAPTPTALKDRVASITDPTDKSANARIKYLRVGARIFRDYPLFGIGQNSFPKIYEKYASADETDPFAMKYLSHLHNNLAQIGVERGIFALIAWIMITIAPLYIMLKRLRFGALDRTRESLIACAIAVALFFHLSGLFEYNFGDSEIQIIFLALLGIGLAGASGELRSSGAFKRRFAPRLRRDRSIKAP